jgi:hypothetical protein
LDRSRIDYGARLPPFWHGAMQKEAFPDTATISVRLDSIIGNDDFGFCFSQRSSTAWDKVILWEFHSIPNPTLFLILPNNCRVLRFRQTLSVISNIEDNSMKFNDK